MGNSAFGHRRRLKLQLFILPVLAAALGFIVLTLRGRGPSTAERAYVEFINALDYPEGYRDYPYLDYLRFELGYVNDDDIPELFLCTGNGGGDTVSIYSYNEESKAVEVWGRFSSRGRLSYCEKQGVTISTCGDQGYFPRVYEQVGHGVREILAAAVEYDGEDGFHYYLAYPYDGPADDVSVTLAEGEITAEEYMAAMAELDAAYPNEMVVEYDSMTEYTEEAFHEAF